MARLWLYRASGGRPGWSLRALWRAYVASYVLNLNSTNDLIRRLEVDAPLRRLCGFGKQLPHRTTFNRFFNRLTRHPELVNECFTAVTEKLRELVPDLGGEVAIDSTTVRTHGNPHSQPLSDPDAGWTAKHSGRAKEGGKEWAFGFKQHMVVDANTGIPLGILVTPANRNDSPMLPVLMDATQAQFAWLRPRAAMADRGYDAMSNYTYLQERGTMPIILNRRQPYGQLYEGVYTTSGVPMCIGNVPMEYVRSDPERGHLYRCVGCHLASRKGVRYCDSEVWEDPTRNLRLFGPVRRDGPEWKALYDKRQSVERTFKSLKQSRRLERHCFRGLDKIRLHCLMATLTYSMTRLANLLRGTVADTSWMVTRVA